MKLLIAFILLLLTSVLPARAEEAYCSYDGKDYDSPGFAIPYRAGFYLKARFGCKYRCTCPNGSQWKVTHVHEEQHFSLNVLSEKTGGPGVAKWFICPQSVKADSWQPLRDELGRIYAYTVDPNYDSFPVSRMQTSAQIQEWNQSKCK